ncbi:Protein NUCLEAR FUSION DEFECTIVE 2 [Striga hermonthica]|uniref:Protein NUCLEAR FUSION DEFECTIVE 2 n=1 Tax=Striga hermonthica TaxID=68872 RepID=A0A9N7N7Z5_STRHE|nr:Protein NUCLEAR FUSION DEFECTIVE 2 [Striga hermonthica]
MEFRPVFLILILLSLLSFSPPAFAEDPSLLVKAPFKVSTPFSVSLDNLQKQINYTFKSVGLLRRAMTHASFSEENNKALSILGASIIETSISLQALIKNVDISAKDLNRAIADVSKVESSCDADGTHLGLQNVVRVSRKTNVTSPAVVCGAFRAVFGAIAVDALSSDEAGRVYGKVHRGFGEAMEI